jgi:hypothetical protein
MIKKKPTAQRAGAKAGATIGRPAAKAATKAGAKKTPGRKPATAKAGAKAGATRGRKPANRTTTKAVSVKRNPLIDVSTRRPDSNLPPNPNLILNIKNEILGLIRAVEQYAANLRALDRQRHNGVGLRRQGFIEAALRIASDYPQYYPHWLNTVKFQKDLDLFEAVRTLIDACRSLEEKAWNFNIEASDMVYTDALEYYSQVKDAAERRIDSAEALYAELNVFFKNMGPHGTLEQPTEKQIKRDTNALLHGRKDGEVIIRNVRPKTIAGSHEVVDETFRDSASFKESANGSFKE